MNRRAFFTTVAAGLILPRTAAAQATPAASLPPRPAPVDLGDGMTLIDYRPFGDDGRTVLGELRNDSEVTVDAPVVSLALAGTTPGVAWLSPLIPVIEAGASIPVFGTVETAGLQGDALDRARFSLCTPAEPGLYARITESMDLVFEERDEVLRPDVYRLRGTLTNQGNEILRDIVIRATLVDADGRIIGTSGGSTVYNFAAGQSRSIAIWGGGSLSYRTNPFPLPEGTTYTARRYFGPRGPITLPGCA